MLVKGFYQKVYFLNSLIVVLSLATTGLKLLLICCVHASMIAPALCQESNIDKLLRHVPGIPGEDYPIFPLAPDTSFLCEVQPVEGGVQRFSVLLANTLLREDFKKM